LGTGHVGAGYIKEYMAARNINDYFQDLEAVVMSKKRKK
jgi:hypothetical protein